MKKKLVWSIIGIILILGLIGTGIYFGFIRQAVIGDVIYKPRWGSLGCIKDDSPQTPIKWLDQQTIFNCGDTYLVDECEFKVESTRGGILAILGQYQRCDLNGINCGTTFAYSIRGDAIVNLPAILSGRSYKFKHLGGEFLIDSSKYTKITQKFYPYRLWTEEGGGHWLSRSADCCLADQDELERRDFEYGDWVCLDKFGSNKYRNYVTDWVLTTGNKIYSYLGEQVICGNNVLYDLDSRQMGDGKYYNFQGNTIKPVQCCPHQTANCDSETFTFLPADEPEERECTYNYECENGGIPWSISDTQALQEKCDAEGMCTRETITTECGSDAKCRELYGSNYVCDLTFVNFGKCIESGLIPLPVCGDGICQTGETSINCPVDCTAPPIECGWYEDYYEKETCGFNPLCWAGITEPEFVKGCKISSWVYIAGIVAIIFILIIFWIIINRVRRRPRRRY